MSNCRIIDHKRMEAEGQDERGKFTWMGEANQLKKKWSGYFKLDGKKHFMHFEKVIIDNGRIQATTSDASGHFIIDGTVDETNYKVAFVKRYSESKAFFYRGTINHDFTEIDGTYGNSEFS